MPASCIEKKKSSTSVYPVTMYEDENNGDVCFCISFQSWDAFFCNASSGLPPGAAYTPPPSLASSISSNAALAAQTLPALQGDISSTKNIDDHLAVQAIIRSYQVFFLLSSVTFLLGLKMPEIRIAQHCVY
jgi:hypothetical protein